jgi:hypothetical protein
MIFNNLTRSQLNDLVNRLSPDRREELFTLMKAYDERLYYQMNPAEWMRDFLDIPLNTIKWSLNDIYREKGYLKDDGSYNASVWDGTPDPIYEILTGLAQWRSVACESATGTGKTFLAAAIVCWFLAVFPGALVVTIAPKEDQLKINLWKEISKLFDRLKPHYPNAEILDLKIRMNKKDPALKDAWIATGFVAGVGAEEETATKARGMHAEHMLFIIDEANGVPMPILEAVENTCTAPHNLMLFLGNPNSISDSLHQMAIRPNIKHIIVSAYDHPNVVANHEETPLEDQIQIIPGAVSWKSIFDRRAKYGPEPEYYNNHPLYKAMVRGICPTGSSHSLFTNKTLDTLEQYLEIQKAHFGRRSLWIEEEEWGPNNVPPLATEWGIPAGDPRLQGFTRIYVQPEYTHTNRYLIFGDVAEDAGTGDWHAAVVLDRFTKRIVALIHMRGPRQYYAAELIRLGYKYQGFDWRTDRFLPAVVCWERNAPGALHLIPQFTEYPELYVQRKYDKPIEGSMLNAWGHFTTAKNRPDMITKLEEWGLELRKNPERMPDEIILDEMRIFEWHERKRKYMAREGQGNYDDIMMALAGALLYDSVLPPLEEVPEAPEPDIRAHWLERKKLMEKIRKGLKPKKPDFGFNVSRLPKSFSR